jgi:hypothetical protein
MPMLAGMSAYGLDNSTAPANVFWVKAGIG